MCASLRGPLVSEFFGHFQPKIALPTRSHTHASPGPLPTPAQGFLPTQAGSPFDGRGLHPLDDVRSFMEASQTPFLTDQQGLVALFRLWTASAKRDRLTVPWKLAIVSDVG